VEYGHEVLASLGKNLSDEYENGVLEKNLKHMIQFAEIFPNTENVAALKRQLNWTHIKALIPIDIEGIHDD
jgi:hypothetical protein